MKSKKNALAPVSAVVVATIPEVSAEVIASPAVDYISRARLSGNPLLKANAESRVYANERENGTTLTLLGVIGSIDGVREKARVVSISEVSDALKALRASAFDSDSWKRTEKAYKAFGGTSASPAKKIGPVVIGLIRESKSGLIAGIDPSALSSAKAREALGYSY